MVRNIFRLATKSKLSEKLILAHKELISTGLYKSQYGALWHPESMEKGEGTFPSMRTKQNLDDK
jgi:hypothetical protein